MMSENSPPDGVLQPLPIGDDALRRLLAEAEWQNVGGRGPYLTLARCGTLTIHRHMDLASAQKAMRWINNFGCGNKCVRSERDRLHIFLVAIGDDLSQRPHRVCGRPAISTKGRRGKAWSGRYNPDRKAAWNVRNSGSLPDVDRARAQILAQCRRCPDCAREAGAAHLAKLQREADKDYISPADLLKIPMDELE
jgi:hypothetical protein